MPEFAQRHPHILEVAVVIAVRFRLVHLEEGAHRQRVVAHVVVLYDTLPFLKTRVQKIYVVRKGASIKPIKAQC